MKALAPTLIALLAAVQLSAAPIEKISTLSGKTYRQCEIVKVYPDAVSFTHATGAAKIPFTELPQEWRRRLGYDPARAEAYQRQQEELRQEQAEIRRRQDEQLSEALLAAQEMERVRLLGEQAVARAALEEAAKIPPPTPPLVPEVPALGAVFDSSDYRGAGYRDRPFDYGYGFGGYGFGGYGVGYGYGGFPGYRHCAPYRGSHHHHGVGVRGRIGGVSFSLGR